MKIYWTIKSIPELSQLSASERKRLWRCCCKKAMLERMAKVGLIIACLFAGVGNMLFGSTGAGIGGGVGGFIFGQIMSNKIRPYLRAEIEEQRKSQR